MIMILILIVYVLIFFFGKKQCALWDMVTVRTLVDIQETQKDSFDAHQSKDAKYVQLKSNVS